MGIFKRLKKIEATLKELHLQALGSLEENAMVRKGSQAGLDYSTSLGGGNSLYGKVHAARVHSVDDSHKSGTIKVFCNEVLEEKVFDCQMATPFGGAGYGFFNVPGKGAHVLITEVEGRGWVWFACLQTLEVEPGGKTTDTQPKGTGDEALKLETEDAYAILGREEGDPMQLTHGVPEGFLVYEGNGQPEQSIWKTAKGHKIIMSEKHTEERESKHITIQSLGGKRIILDDADARTETGVEPTNAAGQTGDRIIISDGDEWSDGGPNRIWIQSTAGEAGVEDSVAVYARNAIFLETKEGNINVTILDTEAEDAHILVTNLAKGNLEIDIEEGDIAAVARYRICLNAWNEDESVDPITGIPKVLGSIGLRSKGAFTVRNGMGAVSQNIQMSHKKGWVTMNSGKQGLALFGTPGGAVTGVVKRAHLMGTDTYVTAKEHLHLEADRITINAKSIKFSETTTMPTRDFEEIYNNPIPDSLSPCREIEADTGIAATTEGGDDGGYNLPSEGDEDNNPWSWDYSAERTPPEGENEGSGLGEYDFVVPFEGSPPSPLGPGWGTSGEASGVEVSSIVPQQPVPAAPSTPSTPSTPNAPTTPNAPSTPPTPSAPHQPGAPSTPPTPGTPPGGGAGGPATTANPTAPATPNSPNAPTPPPPPGGGVGPNAPTTPNNPFPRTIPEYTLDPRGPEWYNPDGSLKAIGLDGLPKEFNVTFTNGVGIGGGGGGGGEGGGGEGGGGPNLDTDVNLSVDVGDGGGTGGGTGGGPGTIYGEPYNERSIGTGKLTTGVRYDEDDSPTGPGMKWHSAPTGQLFKQGDMSQPSRSNSSSPQAGWFLHTARTVEIEGASYNSGNLTQDGGVPSQPTIPIIEAAPSNVQALPGGTQTNPGLDSNSGTSSNLSGYDATQVYIPPGGGAVGSGGLR